MKLLKGFADRGREHYRKERELSEEASDILREKIPNDIQGNFQVYMLAGTVIEYKDQFSLKGSEYRKEKEELEKCYQSAIVRTGTSEGLKDQSN